MNLGSNKIWDKSGASRFLVHEKEGVKNPLSFNIPAYLILFSNVDINDKNTASNL
jgi:hypothetical protein